MIGLPPAQHPVATFCKHCKLVKIQREIKKTRAARKYNDEQKDKHWKAAQD